MTMTDPIADMLTRLRNANQAYHDRVTMPYSKIKANIAEVLKAEGYIASWAVEEPVDGAVGKVRAQPRRHPPGVKARPPGVRQGPGAAPRAGRPGRRHHLDVPGAADRSAGP
jgi:small subunit ribosomal protein S8